MEKFFLYTIFAVFLTGANTAAVFAQLVVEEGKITLSVKPGETVVNSLTIYNTSDKTVPVKVYLTDFDYIPPYDGKKNFLPAGASSHSLKDWISFSPDEFHLFPNSKRKVNYSIKVPQDIEGGYYGVLFFEKGTPENIEGAGVKIVSRVGCLFFVEAKNKMKKGKIGDLKIAQNNQITGNFSNAGDVILISGGVYYFMSKEDTIIDRGEINKLYLPPQKQGSFSVNFPKKLDPGAYTLVITFDLQDGDSVVKEVDFAKETSAQIKILEERD